MVVPVLFSRQSPGMSPGEMTPNVGSFCEQTRYFRCSTTCLNYAPIYSRLHSRSFPVHLKQPRNRILRHQSVQMRLIALIKLLENNRQGRPKSNGLLDNTVYWSVAYTDDGSSESKHDDADSFSVDQIILSDL